MPEGPVPVEVTVVVWVNRSEWEAEHGHDDYGPRATKNYDFEEVFRDFVVDEMQEVFVEQDEWSNVERVTR